MSLEIWIICIAIVFARIVDVSLGTLRTISVVQGRAFLSWFLGFFEVLVWIFAVSRVITNLESPIYAVTYAFGFATGNYIGIKLEGWIAFGRQVVRIFTMNGQSVAAALREKGYHVTSFDGLGSEGIVNLLFVELERRRAGRLLKEAARIDPDCFYLVDDIRLAARPAMLHPTPTGWRAILKKK